MSDQASTPTGSAPGAQLAYRVLDHIDAHPESWDQQSWCGTSQCFAGWTVALCGEKPDDPDDPFVKVGGADVHVGTRAVQLLGFRSEEQMNDTAFDAMTEEEQSEGEEPYELFSSTNDRDDLGRIVEMLFGPRPAVNR